MNIKKITPAELKQVKSAFKLVVDILETRVEKNCANCHNWNGKGCTLAGGETPPDNVQENGCASFKASEVPF